MEKMLKTKSAEDVLIIKAQEIIDPKDRPTHHEIESASEYLLPLSKDLENNYKITHIDSYLRAWKAGIFDENTPAEVKAKKWTEESINELWARLGLKIQEDLLSRNTTNGFSNHGYGIKREQIPKNDLKDPSAEAIRSAANYLVDEYIQYRNDGGYNDPTFLGGSFIQTVRDSWNNGYFSPRVPAIVRGTKWNTENSEKLIELALFELEDRGYNVKDILNEKAHEERLKNRLTLPENPEIQKILRAKCEEYFNRILEADKKEEKEFRHDRDKESDFYSYFILAKLFIAHEITEEDTQKEVMEKTGMGINYSDASVNSRVLFSKCFRRIQKYAKETEIRVKQGNAK